MRATRYYIQFLLFINNESHRKWVTLYTIQSFPWAPIPLPLLWTANWAGTLKELNALQWGQIKRANPLPPGLPQINTTAVFIHGTIE